MALFPTLTYQRKKITRSNVSVPTQMMTATLSSARVVRHGNTLNVTIPATLCPIFISAQIVGQGLWTERERQSGRSDYESNLTVVTGNPKDLLLPKVATRRRPSLLPQQQSRRTAGTNMKDTTLVRSQEI